MSVSYINEYFNRNLLNFRLKKKKKKKKKFVKRNHMILFYI